jgi:hypothetical protein
MNLGDILAIEGEAATQEEYYEALQRAINNGMAWKLQGSYGRAAMDAIKGGFCLLGRVEHNDYYGNHVPGRDQVVNGTVGSINFVTNERGQEWAQTMEAI